MSVHRAKNELRRMKIGDLLRLASEQKISRCLVGGRTCGLYFKYKGFYFCISEILGKGCVYERVEKPSILKEEVPSILPYPHPAWKGPALPVEKGIPFKVYYRDEATHSITLLGRIFERRTKERKNNLSDLLVKAARDFSDRVSDPSLIFLLGP